MLIHIIKLLQSCFKEILIDQEILENGNFGRYTESMIKIYQERNKIEKTGIIDEILINSIKGILLTNKKFRRAIIKIKTLKI